MATPGKRFVSLPVTADEDLSESQGLGVYAKGSPAELALCDDGAAQADTQELAFLGVCVAGATAGNPATAQETGVVDAIAGTGGVAIGDMVVCENGTAKFIAFDSATVSTTVNYYAGQAKTAAAADGTFQLDLDKAGIVL